jgi:hypothetical protein
MRELLTYRGNENSGVIIQPVNNYAAPSIKPIDFSEALGRYVATQRFMKPEFSIKVV